MLKKVVFILSIIFFSKISSAQEISCKVMLNADQLAINTAGDKQIFEDIRLAIGNFINTQRWSSDIFSEKEKIKCNLNINLLRSSGQYRYSGNAQFQVTRPVFGSTYETVIFQYVDRSFDFSFAPEDRTMIFNEQSFTNNLTFILAYYSLIALAIDYDSFGKLAGSPFLERAFNLANLAGNAVGGAWAQSSKSDVRNRYWLVENLRDQQFNSFREGFYEYHRLALDDFNRDPVAARKIISNFLQVTKATFNAKPNSAIINSFFDAKSEELIKIYSEGSKSEKQQAFALVSSLDPGKTEAYRKMLK